MILLVPTPRIETPPYCWCAGAVNHGVFLDDDSESNLRASDRIRTCDLPNTSSDKWKCAGRQVWKLVFLLSTGNSWEDRKNFVKRPNKFYPLEIDYGQDNEELKSSIAAGSKSLLAPAIQELIKMIFDVESMKKTLIEFEVSTKDYASEK